MTFSPSRDELDILLREADRTARRILRQFHLPQRDLEDLRQDLILDALVRMRVFNPARGTVGAFLATVMGHKAQRIGRHLRADRQFFGFQPLSLDSPVSNADGATLVETIANEAGLWAQAEHSVSTAEVRIDVAQCMAALEHPDVELCHGLMHHTIDDLADAGFGSRATLYRRLRAIRCALRAFGLQAA